MTLLQVMSYFLREAALSMRRGWKVSLLAMVTIGVSLFVGSLFLLMGRNLSSLVEAWRGETKAILYFQAETPPATITVVGREVAAAPWVDAVVTISAEEARRRFQDLFPALGDLVEGWGDEPLPASLEIGFDPTRVEAARFRDWLQELRSRPEVQMVDDDRDWLAQIGTLVTLAKSLGMGLGAVLLGAAIFTIASVVRMTAYQYRHEIEVMRLVGATEFLIRGPFLVEGLLQGLFGACLALGGLIAAWRWLAAGGPSSLLGSVLAAEFLPWGHIVFIVGVGAAAGLLGAMLSLRPEVSERASRSRSC